MSERTDLKIFIASSSDVNDIRDESLKVIVEINKNFHHLHLEPILFELDTSSGNNPGFDRIQDRINPLLDDSNIVVVIFYSRVGAFTKEEFDRAKNQGKKTFVYLKEGYQPNAAQESAKYTEVLQLKELIETESQIRYQKFKCATDYNGVFYKDLHKYIEEKYSQLAHLKTDIGELTIAATENKLFHYPRPKPYFTGREIEIEEFKTAIDNHSNFITVDGPGGIGKSQFISRCIELFIPDEKIVWYDCTSSSQFDTLISDAGYPELLKGGSKTDREKFSAFKDKIEENESFLFLNNFHETNNNPVFKDFLEFIQEFLKKGNVVVIDRDNITNFKLTPKRIHIAGFKENRLEYAKALIGHSYKNTIIIDDNNLDKLCEELQGYPLAIDFALYLLSEGVTPSEIITKIVQEAEAEEISGRLLNAIFSRPDAIQEERDFISQFSVFIGSVPHEAINEIIDARLVNVAPRLLRKKNLLSFTDNNYELHPLVREFCYKELIEKEVIHSKVAEYYISKRTDELSPSLEEQIFYHLAKSKQWDRIEKEIEEKGRQFIRYGQLGLVRDLLDKLTNIGIEKPIFNILYGDIAEIQGKWNEAKEYYNFARLDNYDAKIKAQGIIKYGEIIHREGETKEAFEFYEEAYKFCVVNSFLKEKARAANDIGLVYDMYGDLDKAYENFIEGLNIRIDIQDNEGIATSLSNIGYVYQVRGKLDDALLKFNESLTIEESLGNKSGIALALKSCASVYHLRGDLDRALDNYNICLKIHEEIGDKSGIANALNSIGNLFMVKGEIDRASKKYNESLEIFQTIGSNSGISASLQLMGDICLTKNKFNESLTYYNKSLEIGKSIGDKSSIAKNLSNIATVYLNKKNYSVALNMFNESYNLLFAIGDKSELSKVLNNIGSLFLEMARYDEAIEKLESSLKIKEQIGNKLGISATHHNIGTLYVKKRTNTDLALLHFFKAYCLAKDVGASLDVKSTLRWIIAIRDDIVGLEKFKILANSAFNKLTDEMKNHIYLKDFLKEPVQRVEPKIGRNNPCPCGSGKKFKNCHGLVN